MSPERTADRPAPRYPLDTGSGVPLYLQVERSLQHRLEQGEWKYGEQVPTEGEMCRDYGVSRVTMRQALARLVDRGLLTRERGRGTFVRDTSLTAGGRGVTSFTTELAQLGMDAGGRVLSRRVVTAAEADVVDALQLEPRAPVVELVRLRTGAGKPMGIQTSALPLHRFPGLADLDLDNRSLYATLRERYGLVPTEAVETFTVSGVPADVASLLEVQPDAHAFHVERLTLDAHGPFEYVRSIMRGDRYRVRLVLREP